MQQMSTRNPKFNSSLIRMMTRVALENDAINLAQGFPDFDPPKQLLDRLAQVSYNGPHQYPITFGAVNYRRAVAAKCSEHFGRTVDPDTEVLATIGSTEAMVDTLFALTNPGDRVVMFSPFFENYKAQTIFCDCEPVFVPLIPPTYRFDANVLEEEFKKGAKAIILCNPANPSGRVFTLEEMTVIADLCKKYDVFCITDEVYEYIVYEGHKMVYMASLPGMWERTISCNSLSKTYSITGWRLGYVTACKQIMDRIKQYHDFNTVGNPAPLMEAAVTGLTLPDSYYEEFTAHYTHMKDLFCNGFRSIGIPFTEPEGTYFVLADMSPFMKKDQTDEEFCVAMAKKLGVAVVPGSSFFNEPVHGIVRLHFAKVDDTLNEALNRLQNIRKMLD
ncbi:MAG: aminotransferase class I/II-fold pyridoxal phosphate-dependent enzyme [Firmicutes bacterium]|nr:aminotransferase class I/II-fold pyridoxal phosphate-dependent enzyme [Bacillota bacterium]